MNPIDPMNPYEPPRIVRRSWLPAVFAVSLGFIVLTVCLLGLAASRFGDFGTMNRSPRNFQHPDLKIVDDK